MHAFRLPETTARSPGTWLSQTDLSAVRIFGSLLFGFFGYSAVIKESKVHLAKIHVPLFIGAGALSGVNVPVNIPPSRIFITSSVT